MSDPTARFGFALIGGNVVIQPEDYNALVQACDDNLPDPADGDAAAPTPATGVAIVSSAPGNFRHIQLQLTDFVVTVDDSDGEYGGSAFITLPDKNLIFSNGEANLSVVKGNAAGGIGAADPITMGIGTAVASNNTLSTTMQNIVPVTAIATNALTVTFAASTFSAVGTQVSTAVPDGASNHLYLNATATGSVMTADDTLTCTGTIDLWFLEVGNVTS